MKKRFQRLILLLSIAASVQSQNQFIFIKPTYSDYELMPYKKIREIIYQLKMYHVEELSDLEYLDILFLAIKNRTEAKISIEKKPNGITIESEKSKVLIHDLKEFGLDSALDNLKQEIIQIIKKYELRTDYENYLCRLLSDEAQAVIYDKNDSLMQRTEFNSNFRFSRDKKGNVFNYRVVYSRNNMPVKIGSVLIELNGIPAKLLSKDMIEEILFRFRDSIVQMKFTNGKDTTEIFYNDKYNPSVENLYLKKYNGNILYAKLTDIKKRDADLIKFVLESDSGNIEKIIIDLRGNLGGSLIGATEVAGLFIEKEKIIAEVNNRNLGKTTYYSKTELTFKKYKLFAITDSLTASGAEIILGAIKTYNPVTIIGTETSGTGAVKKHFSTLFENIDMIIPYGSVLIANEYTLGKNSFLPDISTDKELSLTEIIKLVTGIK